MQTVQRVLARVRPLLLLLAVTAMVAGPVGCGSSRRSNPFVGTLQVHNEVFSTDVVEAIAIDEVGGPDSFFFNVLLFPDQSFFVDLFPTTYDVTIFWGDGTTETFFNIDIFDGLRTHLHVAN